MPGPKLERIELTPEEQAALEARGAAPDRTSCRGQSRSLTGSPKRADPAPGPKPAPELARYDKILAERAGVPAPGTEPASPGPALGVLAAVLDHDGQQQSATQTRHQALADADHLAVLHAIWAAETAPNPATRPAGCGAPCAPPN
jgi:hypothetical protein